MSAPQTAGMALAAATDRLRKAGVPDPARDARRLLAHAADIEASRVTLIAPDPLPPAIAANFDALVQLRSRRVPVSQLVGWRDFYGRRFAVSRHVLDPRPETETLIEAALAEPFGMVLDLGTGSGCILVTLLAERERATGIGTDISEEALLEAASNAVQLGVADRADFLRSDWFSEVRGEFDLIVSNPPYIAIGEMQALSPEVRQHEPWGALTDGGDGLSAYAAICAAARGHLSPGGRLMFEIGPTQGRAVLDMMTMAGLRQARILSDLDGRDRVVVGEAPGG